MEVILALHFITAITSATLSVALISLLNYNMSYYIKSESVKMGRYPNGEVPKWGRYQWGGTNGEVPKWGRYPMGRYPMGRYPNGQVSKW